MLLSTNKHDVDNILDESNQSGIKKEHHQNVDNERKMRIDFTNLLTNNVSNINAGECK